MNTPTIRAITLLTLCASPALAQNAQPLRFAHVLDDHAVVQRDQPLRIWGHGAATGSEVVVTFTQSEAEARELAPAAFESTDDRSGRDPDASQLPTVRMHYVDTAPVPIDTRVRTATVDDSGRWEVRFEPLHASFTPSYIVATAGDEAAVLDDILVGDVWLASGQSNMVWGAQSDSEWGLEKLSVDYPAVRLCRILKFTSQPLEDLERRARWRPATPENDDLGGFSGVSYFFAVRMHRALKVPIGIINNSVGGSMAETWMPRESLEHLAACDNYLADYDRRMVDWPAERVRRQASYDERLAQAERDGKKPPRKPNLNPPDKDRNQPAGCYNGSIHPIKRLTLRGALFLQGENNAIGKWNMYAQSFPQMIRDWRRVFESPELPFGILTVQGFGPYGRDVQPEMMSTPPGTFWYAAIREVHRQAHLALPYTGLIAAADIGDTANIHPGLKREVAQRTARWALAQVHGKDVLFTGPTYRSMAKQDGKILLQFDMDPNLAKVLNIKPGETVWWRDYPISRVGKDYRGFFIAGADRRFYPAAVRRGKTPGTLEVSSDAVAEPEAVRYAWSGYPDANAIGHDFLPVFPFRTDDWPLHPDAPFDAESKSKWNDGVAASRATAERLALERQLADSAALLDEVARSLSRGQSAEQRAALEQQVTTLQEQLNDLRSRLREQGN